MGILFDNDVKLPSKTLVASVIGGMLGITTLSTSLYTVETGTVGVLSTFREYSKEEVVPGLHLKIPYIQSIKFVDVKMQTANYNSAGDNDDSDGIYNLSKITVLDEKNLPIGIDVSIQFNVQQDKASEVLEKYGVNYYEKAIHPVIRDVVRNVVGKYQAETIASQRQLITSELEVAVQLEMDKLPEFTVTNIALRDIDLPPLVMEKIKQVQEAKQEESRLKMVDLQAQQDQRIKETQANTLYIQVTTAAKAESEKRKIEAEGQAYAILTEAKAQADANLLIAKSISPELVKYREVNRWDGKMPTTLVKDGGTGLILNTK